MAHDPTVPAILYGRVSTMGQAGSGLGLAAQRAQCEAYCTIKGIRPVEWLEDAGASGDLRPAERPGLTRALAMLASGEAKALVVSSLSRLSRRVRDVLDIAEAAQAQGWRLCILDLQLDTCSPTGKAMLGMMAVLAELERDLAIERTREALQAAKAAGKRLGAPVSEATRAAGARALVLREAGESWRAIARTLESEGYRTAQGHSNWQGIQAQRAARTVELDREAARLRGE